MARRSRKHERITAILDDVYDLLPAEWDSWGRHKLPRSSDMVWRLATKLNLEPWDIWKALERLRGDGRVQRVGRGRYVKAGPLLVHEESEPFAVQTYINRASVQCDLASAALALGGMQLARTAMAFRHVNDAIAALKLATEDLSLPP